MPARENATGADRTRATYGWAFAAAVLVAVVLRGFCLQGFAISSTSMVPTLLAGDHVLVSPLPYGIRAPWGYQWIGGGDTPNPGDIVVFRAPHDRNRADRVRTDYVKRVVAVAGETVEVRNHAVLVNGVPRDFPEACFNTIGLGAMPADSPAQTVPAHHFFVMGDNRRLSHDSREWGVISVEDLIGKALLIYWSWDPLCQCPRWNRVGRMLLPPIPRHDAQ